MEYQLMYIDEAPEWLERAAMWFHQKWGIPLEAYRESMEESLRTEQYPRCAGSASSGDWGSYKMTSMPAGICSQMCAPYMWRRTAAAEGWRECCCERFVTAWRSGG